VTTAIATAEHQNGAVTPCQRASGPPISAPTTFPPIANMKNTLCTRPRSSSGTRRCRYVVSTLPSTELCTPNTTSTAPAAHGVPASARPRWVRVSTTRPARSSSEAEQRDCRAGAASTPAIPPTALDAISTP